MGTLCHQRTGHSARTKAELFPSAGCFPLPSPEPSTPCPHSSSRRPSAPCPAQIPQERPLGVTRCVRTRSSRSRGADGNSDHGGAGVGRFWPPLRFNLAHTFHSKPISWLLTPFLDSDLSRLRAQACAHTHAHTHGHAQTHVHTHTDTHRHTHCNRLRSSWGVCSRAWHPPLQCKLPRPCPGMLPAAAASLAPTQLSRVQPGPGVLQGGGAPSPRSHVPARPPSHIPVARVPRTSPTGSTAPRGPARAPTPRSIRCRFSSREPQSGAEGSSPGPSCDWGCSGAAGSRLAACQMMLTKCLAVTVIRVGGAEVSSGDGSLPLASQSKGQQSLRGGSCAGSHSGGDTGMETLVQAPVPVAEPFLRLLPHTRGRLCCCPGRAGGRNPRRGVRTPQPRAGSASGPCPWPFLQLVDAAAEAAEGESSWT